MIEDWQVATVQLTERTNGFIGVQVDGLGDGATLGQFYAHHPYGFRGRPRDPDERGVGCSVLYGWEGGRGHALVMGDPRDAAKLPDEGAGGSVQYGVTAAGDVGYVLVRGDDGRVVVKVPSGADSIRLEHGESGPSIEVNDSRVELGGAGGMDVVVNSYDFIVWMNAIQLATGIAPPASYTATKVKAV